MTRHRKRDSSKPRDFTAHARERVINWQKQHGITVLDDNPAKMALRLFVQHGCDPVQLLELLRVYALGHSDTFEIATSKAEKAREKVMRVVRLLRKAAIALRELAILPELPEGEADDADAILEMADNLESYLKVIEWGEAYKKKFGRTLAYLVLASKLVLLRTGRMHFDQLSELLNPILQKHQPNRKERTPDAFRKQVARFDRRYPEIVEELTDLSDKGDSLQNYVESWLTTWKQLEASVWNEKGVRNRP